MRAVARLQKTKARPRKAWLERAVLDITLPAKFPEWCSAWGSSSDCCFPETCCPKAAFLAYCSPAAALRFREFPGSDSTDCWYLEWLNWDSSQVWSYLAWASYPEPDSAHSGSYLELCFRGLEFERREQASPSLALEWQFPVAVWRCPALVRENFGRANSVRVNRDLCCPANWIEPEPTHRT